MFNIDLSKNSLRVTRCIAILNKLSDKVYNLSKANDKINSFLREKRKELKAKQKDRIFDIMDKNDNIIKNTTNAIVKIQRYKNSISVTIDGLTPMNSNMASTRALKAIGDRINIETNIIEDYKKAVTKEFLEAEYKELADRAAFLIPDEVKLDIERHAAWHHIHQSGCNSSERDSVVMVVMQRYLPKLGLTWSNEDFPGCNLERLEECSK